MKTLILLTISAVGTYVLVFLVAAVAMRLSGVPKDFPPFTALPLLSGVVGGFLGASLTYACVPLFAVHPNRIFLSIALLTLAISLSLPLRLSFTKSKRFSGVTPSAQMTLALLHAIVATAVVSVLTRTEGIR